MSDPQPNPEAVPVPDPELVTLQGTYRIGISPPVDGSLATGELYIQVPADGAAPVMFVGGLAGIVVQMGGTAPLAAAAKVDEHGRVVDPKADPKADPKDDKRK